MGDSNDEMQVVREKIRQLENRQKILLNKKSDTERKERALWGAALPKPFARLTGRHILFGVGVFL